VNACGDGLYETEVPDGWQQGRGAFGGLTIAYAVRAMEERESERPLRALTAELPGPLGLGRAEIRVSTLRRGRGVTTLEAHITQPDENGELSVRGRVSGVFGGERPDDRTFAGPPPKMGSWQDAPPIPDGALPPRFARHFEYRVTGPFPFSGGDAPVAEGWIRPREPLNSWGAAEVVAMADAYWPAIFATQTAPRPMATIAFTLHLQPIATSLPTNAPLYYRARASSAGGGYVSEARELWTQEGALVALNPQTFVVIK